MRRHDPSQSPGERTEQERERAREERERRRQARATPSEPQPYAPPIPPPESGRTSLRHGEIDPPPPGMPEPPQPGMPEPPPPGTTEPSRGRKPRLARPHRPQLPHPHRPHLPHPHVPRRRSGVPRARTGASRLVGLLFFLAALAALAAVAFVLVRRAQRPKPPSAPAIVKVVIPEGETRAQIAQIARSDRLSGDYLAAAKQALAPPAHSGRSPELRVDSYGAPAHTHSLEGFLFPATYELYAGAPVAQLVTDQLEAFSQNFGAIEKRRARALGVTPYQLLTIASMIEREAAIPHDRPLVSAVIYNRLRRHMPLGIDATIRYALGDYIHPLTEAELKSRSPYNTRTHTGLPPTPISNPGMASIDAAAHPAHVSYLYYVAGADGCGEQVFSTSYAQFERDAAAYREALRRNHGRVPICRKR